MFVSSAPALGLSVSRSSASTRVAQRLSRPASSPYMNQFGGQVASANFGKGKGLLGVLALVALFATQDLSNIGKNFKLFFPGDKTPATEELTALFPDGSHDKSEPTAEILGDTIPAKEGANQSVRPARTTHQTPVGVWDFKLITNKVSYDYVAQGGGYARRTTGASQEMIRKDLGNEIVRWAALYGQDQDTQERRDAVNGIIGNLLDQGLPSMTKNKAIKSNAFMWQEPGQVGYKPVEILEAAQ